MTGRLAPVVTDPATRGHFEAAAEGRLAVLTCADCGQCTHLPRPRCVHCGGAQLDWCEVSRTGRARSWTVVEHQVHPAFPAPYTVVLIEISDHPDVRMIGYLPGRVDVTEATVLHADFEDLGSDADGTPIVMPRWQVSEHTRHSDITTTVLGSQ